MAKSDLSRAFDLAEELSGGPARESSTTEAAPTAAASGNDGEPGDSAVTPRAHRAPGKGPAKKENAPSPPPTPTGAEPSALASEPPGTSAAEGDSDDAAAGKQGATAGTAGGGALPPVEQL